MTVSADLSLARQLNVKIQDLPMLCKRVLQQRPDQSCSLPISVTAEAMRGYSQEDAAASLERQKSGKGRAPAASNATKPPSSETGVAYES
jgi:hypothetical protein